MKNLFLIATLLLLTSCLTTPTVSDKKSKDDDMTFIPNAENHKNSKGDAPKDRESSPPAASYRDTSNPEYQ